MAMDHAVLKTEIETDPAGLGLTFSKSDRENAEIISTIGTATADITRERADPVLLESAVVSDDYLLMDQTQRDLWAALLDVAKNGLPLTDTNIRGQLRDCWPPGTTTRDNMAEIQTKPAAESSRSEELFGDGIQTTDLDVAIARGL